LGMFPKPHLANLARLMGLPGKVGMDGSKVYETWKEYDLAKKTSEGHQESISIATSIDKYCLQDVIQTAFVFQRFRYLAGKLTLEQYHEAASALLEWTAAQPGQEEFAAAIDKTALLLREDVSLSNADPDDRGKNLVSAGSGGDAA